ncbi:hypothetical protein [Burkholderia aenigmatica]|uniref:hypothetical protein n=1 Tax=Burkholderia aenigmatica TaxID=2015348 RepID=UPI0015821FCE|nr:hypothetical protein [Burkholderia aenigmatica]
MSFAHLTGGKRAARADDDQKQGDRDDESAEGDDPQDRDRDDGDSSGSKGKKGKRAEDDRDDENAEDDELEEDDSGKGKKGKRAEDDDPDDERAEDEDDDEEEMRGKSAVARARRRERARCAAIMGSKAAGRNVELAANLAFNTSMTRKEALAILRASPAADSGSARSQARAERNPRIGAGGEVHRNPPREAASGWDRAFSKITGKRA